MSFTDAEKTDLRRFCGYPAYGAGNSGFQTWRFFQAYGELEYRLDNLSPVEEVVVRNYLTELPGLEAAIPAASDNLDTAAAGPWTWNRHELRDRRRLWNQRRRDLCDVIGVPYGPSLAGQGGCRFVV